MRHCGKRKDCVMSNNARDAGEALAAGAGDPIIAEILHALRGLRYGMVCIAVQDGVVVQIERTEKHRLRRDERSRDGSANLR
jgi:hypothetical protein